MPYLIKDDPEVARIIRDEETRVENTLDLIAAENHAPASILEAQGSVFNLKAAEGFPGNRFHAGCRHADELEQLAISRAKDLFGAEHANVQPHSGVAANLAVYFSLLDIGDRILSMKLSHGGHLSHGGVILCKQDHADRIDRAIFPGGQGTPSLNFIAAKAVCFHLAMADDFVDLQKKTLKNAACFAAEFERLGYRIVSGGTDNHLLLIDLRPKGLTGAGAEKALESVGINVNRNVIPGDPQKPHVASGIRIGSPAISTRGMAEPEVQQIVRIMDAVMSNNEDSRILGQVANEVKDLCNKFPIKK